MKLPKFTCLSPRTAREACSLLKEHGEKAMAIGGGSDLLVNMKNRLKIPEYLVDLKALPRLDGVTFTKAGGLSLGAMATLRDLIENPQVREKYPILVQAAEAVGTPQLQYMGTIGGNLCLDNRCYYYNQSLLWHQGRAPCLKLGGDTCYVVKGSETCWATYCADMAPAFLALGAEVKVATTRGSKSLPLGDIYSGDGKKPNKLGAGEFIAGVEIPALTGNSGGAYMKLRRRQAIDFPLLGVAVQMEVDGNVCRDVRVAMTAVEKGPIMVEEASLLKGKGLEGEALDKVLEAARSKAHPLDNLLGFPPTYRKDMVKVYLKRTLEQAFQAAKKGR